MAANCPPWMIFHHYFFARDRGSAWIRNRAIFVDEDEFCAAGGKKGSIIIPGGKTSRVLRSLISGCSLSGLKVHSDPDELCSTLQNNAWLLPLLLKTGVERILQVALDSDDLKFFNNNADVDAPPPTE